MSVASVMTSERVRTTRTACDPSTAETFDQVKKRPGAAALNTPSRIINAPINPYFSTCPLSLANERLFGVIGLDVFEMTLRLSYLTTVSNGVFCQFLAGQ